MLTEKTKNYIERVKDTEKTIISLVGAEDILDMDERTVVMLKKFMVLLDESCNLIVAQAVALDDITTKLDKLIAKK